MPNDPIPTIAVLTPSRLDRVSSGGSRRLFLEDALRSIRGQKVTTPVRVQVFVGVDQGVELPGDFPAADDIVVVHSGGRSQAEALNAAAAVASELVDYVTFLEDDDIWSDGFLSLALEAVQTRDFVSSTQLEVSLEGEIQRIYDFATPSGWFMPTRTFKTVGLFDTTHRWHLDNEWLGRLNRAKARRGHLVEATAPIEPRMAMQVRPWLVNVMRTGSDLIRHGSPYPLIIRRVHPNSGMGRIQSDPKTHAESQAEYQRLVETYGGIPW